MDAFYFSDVFLNAPEVDVEQQTQKLSNEYTWKSETDVFRNSFLCTDNPLWKCVHSRLLVADFSTRKCHNQYAFSNKVICTYQHRDSGASNGGKVICEYLGNWHGQDIVARYYRTGGSGSFSDIVFCSINGRKMKVHKTILLGDRAMNGLLRHPIFDGKGQIY
jgi:hypothetical protein